MVRLNNPRSYAAITGFILFLLGFLGFAFRSSFDIPDSYLFASLVLGFWGLMVGVGNRNNK